MTSYVSALRILAWTAIVVLFGLAVVAAVTARPDFCPLGMNPTNCVTNDGGGWMLR